MVDNRDYTGRSPLFFDNLKLGGSRGGRSLAKLPPAKDKAIPQKGGAVRLVAVNHKGGNMGIWEDVADEKC